MFENFSSKALEIIDEALQIAKKMESKLVGSEHLLLAMFKKTDTICHFLLSEKGICYEDLINIINNLVILRKQEVDELTYTKKFQEIILFSEHLAKDLHNKNVYDEHIFYVMLREYDNVACVVLEKLDFDIDTLMQDIEEIFNFFSSDTFEKEESKQIYPFLTNLSTTKKIHPFVKRKDYIEKLIYILSKKQKNNPLLIGNAGVGKTAIVEGLSEILKDETIYQLDLGSIVSGTKYRGELEEKITKAMEFIKKEKAIVFIDEIHNIVGAGSNDGSLDIANILKPYLSRADIKLIGSTTLDEYYRYIEKDKALTRRFQNVFIDEPTKEETLVIVNGIKKSYEEFHNVKFSNQHIKTILDKCSCYLVNRTFPDKAIDVLDEVGSRKKITNEKMENIIDQVLYDAIALKPLSCNKLKNISLVYPSLKHNYIKFISKDRFNLELNNMGVITVEKKFNTKYLLKDLEKVFGFKKEMYLEIDLSTYQDVSSINNLIGSSKGYVGYDQGGELSEHIIKYPMSVIYLKNLEMSHISIQNFFKSIFSKNKFTDNKARRINLTNTLFLVDHLEKNKNLAGFIIKNKEEIPVKLLDSKQDAPNFSTIIKELKKDKITIENIKDLSINELEECLCLAILEGPGEYIYNKNNSKLECKITNN